MAFYDIHTQRKKMKNKVKLTPDIMKSSSFVTGFTKAAVAAGLTDREAIDLLKQAQAVPTPGVQADDSGILDQIITELLAKSQTPRGGNAIAGAGTGALTGGLAGAGLGGLIGAQTGRNNESGDKSGRNALLGALAGGGLGTLGGGAIGGIQGWGKELGLIDSIKQRFS
jgi:hypothetical protein